MSKMKGMPFWSWVIPLFLIMAFTGVSLAKDAPRISKEELKTLMGKANVVILDVRVKGDWEGSKEKIRGAVWEDPGKKTKDWADKYPKDRTLVFYCA